MTMTLPKILHEFRLATQMSCPTPDTTLRLVTDRLSGQQVLAADWTDLGHVCAWLNRNRRSGAYLLVGSQNGRRRVRVGEGVKLWRRLPDHRADASLSFVAEIYLLVSPSFNKSATVYLQEQLSEIVEGEAQIDWHKGCRHLQDFPLSDDDRKMLDLALMLGLNLLNAAGLRLLRPEQSRLAGQVQSLLTQSQTVTIRA
ncbi:hypothetical protein ASF22_20150 [Methylobacterium sp. Leaf87]|uniref:hypothetical protein n=1 Tax=Methylobacterium sp. Leaf87 TaxID=1736243 RepID=UPI0006F39A11|nr:hypothetical protein [Methylobacterium sp. Leaf87]KQO67589.1 hypothetical protein ASF22_20150 [Methylobacterium sp. Leaf87]